MYLSFDPQLFFLRKYYMRRFGLQRYIAEELFHHVCCNKNWEELKHPQAEKCLIPPNIAAL